MKRSAYSLIELVAVIAIMGITVALGVPKYVNSMHSYRLSAATKRIVKDIEYAQLIAKRANTSQTIQFSAANSNYLLVGVAGIGRKSSTFQVEIDDQPYYGTITAVTFQNNSSSVVFDRFGVPDTTGTVSVKCGSYTKVVTINATGKVTVQ